MNIRTIRDLLIDAVRLDREMHEHVGPRHLRAQQIPYEHDFADKAGWGKIPGDKKCQLATEDGDPHKALRRDFWEQYNREPTPSEIARADTIHGWLMFVNKPEERRALVGWANSKAGGKSFRRWCLQVEGISTTTGIRRKNRALDQIGATLARKPMQNDENDIWGELSSPPEIGDVSPTIAEAMDDIEGLNNWVSAGARPDVSVHYKSDRSGDREIVIPQSAFSWAAKRNQRRRQRDKRKRMREAA